MWFVPAVETLGDHECGGMTRREAELVAALPEWIAAHDAEREGRLRAEARERALEEALGEALEASREPRAEKALAEIREWAEFVVYHSSGWGPGTDFVARGVLKILHERGFGGGS